MTEFKIDSKAVITCYNEEDANKVDDMCFELSSKINNAIAGVINEWWNKLDEDLNIDVSLDTNYNE